MAKWKLSRQDYGVEEFTAEEGDKVTIGRGLNNTITLTSIVISRNHCELIFQKDQVIIKDLQSSNGIYIKSKKIPPNVPYVLQDSDLIGMGWSKDAPLTKIKDSEKYVFKLTKHNNKSYINRLKFQSNPEKEDIELNLALLDEFKMSSRDTTSPILPVNTKTKRKIEEVDQKPVLKAESFAKNPSNHVDSVITLQSDSDNDVKNVIKKPKLEMKEEPITIDSDDLQYEAFKVKQEYLGYDDEVIEIDIDSESDSESEQWMIRLSQSSPGKPFIKVRKDLHAPAVKSDDTSYSQLDDLIGDNFLDDNDEEYDDIISIPPHPPVMIDGTIERTTNEANDQSDDADEILDDLIVLNYPRVETDAIVNGTDGLDGICPDVQPKEDDNVIISTHTEVQNESVKKAKIIEPLAKPPKAKSISESKTRTHRSKKTNEVSSKRHISNSLKEERKKKLKEIATKDKESVEQKANKDDINNCNRSLVNAKVTTSNRGAFLTDTVQLVKPNRRKHSSNEPVEEDITPNGNIENKDKVSEKPRKQNLNRSKQSNKHDSSRSKSHSKPKKEESLTESRVPLKNLKPLSESEKSLSGKPFSKVEPLNSVKPKKSVRFSDKEPEVRLFEIEPGNKMRRTSLVKTTLVDARKMPIFSLEKITLMKILRWNPHWLNEQMNNNEPPPILGHNNPPMSIFHSFTNHNQYVQLVGDLLLMEIWECLTQAYMRINFNIRELEMRIESLPPIPTQDRSFELFSLSVNVSLLNSESRYLPRVGEIMMASFGPENCRNVRFFFVHNIRALPSPPNNIRSFYSISLHSIYTEKMCSLKPGEVMSGRSLAYINKELTLFEAMEYVAGSPLSEAILRPEPRHFIREDMTQLPIKSQWTATLNPSQHVAVSSSVAAALSDRPSIQMVQGPPGTGKSAVICAIVMSYFYSSVGKKLQSRGKILICATSNAAVDELVIRLLKIRQDLPKGERFKMVRVGRAEAMHPRAFDVSSQQLATRDARMQAEPTQAGLNEEISHLEAKINMWKTAAQDAKDPVRIAYCQDRVSQLAKRIALLRSGGGCGEVKPEHIAHAERRIIEGADIIVTTLASAHNHKMRGLKRRIALCIVDEAGQAIEPETLIPLTLDVTRLTLIGDPQQLPGFICSQRAKKHGLGESLFSRLTSCAEQWPGGSPVVLLNEQYRMHQEIADYPNRAFYGGQILTALPSKTNIGIPPYTIVSISSGDKGQGSSGANEMEAWGVTRLVKALVPLIQKRNLNLAVITPYNAHKDLIKNYLKSLQDPSEREIEVNTVDSFQGQERDVVVVSLARSNGVGFLTDAGRMNVMLTRAKHALLVCLNPQAMLKNNQWRTLVEDAQKRKLYRVLPNKVCQPLSAGTNVNEDILKYINQKPGGYK